MLTTDCDVYFGIQDGFINNIISTVRAQRPSIFNLATPWFAENPDALCLPVQAAPNGAPPLGIVDPISVGTGPAAIQYCLQISEVSIDFPPWEYGAPSELGSYTSTHALLRLSINLRLAIPEISVADLPCPSSSKDDKSSNFKSNVAYKLTDCTSISVFSALGADYKTCQSTPNIYFDCAAVEIVDLEPTALEGIIEVLLQSILNLDLLSGALVALNIDPVRLPGGRQVSLTLSPASSSPKPTFEDDTAKIKLDALVSTS